MVYSVWIRTGWSITNFSASSVKLSNIWKNGKKDVFHYLRQAYQSSLTMMHHVKGAESHIYFNSAELQNGCDSLAKNNFVRATFRKFGTMEENWSF